MSGKPVVNMFEAPAVEWGRGSRYQAKLARLGDAVGAEQLGATLHTLPPGKAAFPRHAHHRNEEMFVIIRGSGEYRAGDESWPVKEGDVIAAPAGNGEAAHQMRNDSEAELVYLAVSTRHDPDVVEYPDSGKFAVASMVPAEGGIRGARIAFIGKQEDSLDYWDGEDIGEEQE